MRYLLSLYIVVVVDPYAGVKYQDINVYDYRKDEKLEINVHYSDGYNGEHPSDTEEEFTIDSLKKYLEGSKE